MDTESIGPDNNSDSVKLVPARCTNCSGELTVDPSQEAAVCKYCGTPFVISKAIRNYTIQNNTYQTNVVNDQRKGTVEAILSYKSEQEEKKYNRKQQEKIRAQDKKKRRNSMILWVLGWIFIFPVPLTILVLRSKTFNWKVKLGIIAAAWIAYLIIFFIVPKVRGTSSTPATNPSSSVTETTAATTTATTTESTTEATTSETTAETSDPEDEKARKAVADGDYSLVSKDFKKTMDSYEKFYDKYIKFMKKYKSGKGDMTKMMKEYMDMLSQLEDWSKKMEKIDESKLSAADDAYFLLVTARIEKKLLDAAIT